MFFRLCGELARTAVVGWIAQEIKLKCSKTFPYSSFSAPQSGNSQDCEMAGSDFKPTAESIRDS